MPTPSVSKSLTGSVTALSLFASVPALLPTRDRGPMCFSVKACAAFPIDVLSTASGISSSLPGLPFTATRMPLSVFSTMKLTLGLTLAVRPPSNSHSTPALRHASRYGASA